MRSDMVEFMRSDYLLPTVISCTARVVRSILGYDRHITNIVEWLESEPLTPHLTLCPMARLDMLGIFVPIP